MKLDELIIQMSLNRPKTVLSVIILITIMLGTLLSRVHVDTDPENMLNEDEAVRVFHNLTKKDFTLHDVVVLGVVNEIDENGIFNPVTLKKVQELLQEPPAGKSLLK